MRKPIAGRWGTMPPRDNLEFVMKRIEKDEQMLAKHPERKDIITRHMNAQKEAIVQYVMANKGNPALAAISHRA